MDQEFWESMFNLMGQSDEVSLEKLAKCKTTIEETIAGLNDRIATLTSANEDLEFQNRDLNKTNINLALRLTDLPSTATGESTEESEDDEFDINDLDSMVS